MDWTDIALYAGVLLACGGFVAALVAIAIWPEIKDTDDDAERH